MQFLYMGFRQEANMRCYCFQGVVPKERPSKLSKNIEFILAADMSLLAKYHIRLQDGPSLCLEILTTALTAAPDHATQFASYALTSTDLSTYTLARTAHAELKIARRKPRPPFKPSSSSQLKWPQVK